MDDGIATPALRDGWRATAPGAAASLSGTVRNCAGGPTPWGTWLTCEETSDVNPVTGRKHGYTFEVPGNCQGWRHILPVGGRLVRKRGRLHRLHQRRTRPALADLEYHPRTGRLRVLFASPSEDVLSNPDNLGVSPVAGWCGSDFDPIHGKWLFVNIQTPGITFAITGPWRNGSL